LIRQSRSGELLVRREAAGRPLEAIDGYLAAVAELNGLTLVTRNDSAFEGAVRCLNLWS